MSTITFDRFDGGWDVRQLSTSADANRLRELQNAYVTTGRTIRKRPGLKKVGDIQMGTFGLFAGLGKIWTFSTFETEHLNLPALLSHGRLDDPTGKGIKDINGYTRGDQLVHVNVWTPQQLTSEERAMLEKLRDSQNFSPKPGKNDKGFFERMRDFFH